MTLLLEPCWAAGWSWWPHVSVAVEGYAWTSFPFLCLQCLMGAVTVREVGMYPLWSLSFSSWACRTGWTTTAECYNYTYFALTFLWQHDCTQGHPHWHGRVENSCQFHAGMWTDKPTPQKKGNCRCKCWRCLHRYWCTPRLLNKVQKSR